MKGEASPACVNRLNERINFGAVVFNDYIWGSLFHRGLSTK
jgi:hypothetical protein